MTASSPSLRHLLERPELRLRPIGEVRPEDLERPVQWVHNSDLPDPTAFLDDGVVLLTTGTQFALSDAPAAYDAYVERLASRSVVAIGFGTEVIQAGVPDLLADACRAHGMPLLEVPYGTPFIAVTRAHAEAVAVEDYARRTWALGAQRGLALAALRQSPLSETLAELARRTGAGVGMFDALAEPVHFYPERMSPRALAELAEPVAHILTRGAWGSQVIEAAGRRYTVHTLGQSGNLRGVLVVEGDFRDPEARAVLTTAVALTGFALAQQAELAAAHGRLRTGVLQALRRGDASLAVAVTQPVWGSMPPAPLHVGWTPLDADELHINLELRATKLPQGLFFGSLPEGGTVLLLAESAMTQLDDIARRFATAIGVSRPVGYDRLEDGLDQARTAHARGGPGVTGFDEVEAAGLLRADLGESLRIASRALLGPLVAHDAAQDTRLLSTLESWLEHGGRHEEAARVLGVHRHTVRSRIRQIEQILDVDMSSFPVRAQLWLACQARG